MAKGTNLFAKMAAGKGKKPAAKAKAMKPPPMGGPMGAPAQPTFFGKKKGK